MQNKVNELIFEIKGKPQGKARPRFTKQGRAYTPKETREYEREIAEIAHNAAVVQGWRKADRLTPLQVTITAVFPIPPSWTLKQKTAAIMGQIVPTVKPDCDNIAKVVLDSLNGIVFDDDKQVVQCFVMKTYAQNEHDCGVKVEIRHAFKMPENILNAILPQCTERL